jgi:hypothetical protein
MLLRGEKRDIKEKQDEKHATRYKKMGGRAVVEAARLSLGRVVPEEA